MRSTVLRNLLFVMGLLYSLVMQQQQVGRQLSLPKNDAHPVKYALNVPTKCDISDFAVAVKQNSVLPHVS